MFSLTNVSIHKLYNQLWLWLIFTISSHFFKQLIWDSVEQKENIRMDLCQRGCSSELPWRWPKRNFKHKREPNTGFGVKKNKQCGYCFWFKTEEKKRNLCFVGLQRILMPRMCRQGRKFWFISFVFILFCVLGFMHVGRLYCHIIILEKLKWFIEKQ